MMSSLFEIYDPFSFLFGINLSWFMIFYVLLCFLMSFWVVGGQVFFTVYGLLLLILVEFGGLFSSGKMKKPGMGLFISLFLFLILVNLLGLIPYTFSISSHFVFSLSVGFPFWAGLILLGWLENTEAMFMHLIPLGTPFLLIPLMVLIETVSSLIRPWSLSVRLMANMISGHLLMSLLGECGMKFIFVQIVLFMFEFFVCFIQAYVFSVLLTLYFSEL